MAEHLSDEQQLESLKRWWQESGLQLVLVIVLVLGGWFGWQQWQEHKKAKAEAGSLVYIELVDLAAKAPLNQLSSEDRGALQDKAEQLKSDFANSQYAHYAGFMLAKLAVTENRLDDAAQELQIVIDNTDGDDLSHIARLRLARLEMGRKNYPEALNILAGDTPAAMLASVAELRGDIHLFSGDNLAARAAYQSALDVTGADDQRLRSLLELKLNQVLPGLGSEATSAEAPATEDAS